MEKLSTEERSAIYQAVDNCSREIDNILEPFLAYDERIKLTLTASVTKNGCECE